MARKMNVMTASQEVRGLAEVTNRQPLPQMAACLLPPHLQALKISPPRQRKQIVVEMDVHSETAGSVEIIHNV